MQYCDRVMRSAETFDEVRGLSAIVSESAIDSQTVIVTKLTVIASRDNALPMIYIYAHLHWSLSEEHDQRGESGSRKGEEPGVPEAAKSGSSEGAGTEGYSR